MLRYWLLSLSLALLCPVARAETDARLSNFEGELADAIERCVIDGKGEKTAEECDFSLTIQRKNNLLGRSPFARLSHATNGELASAVRSGTASGIDTDIPLPQNTHAFAWILFQTGISPLTDQNEIDADPVRAKVDSDHRAKGENGVWVRQHLVLAPSGYPGVPRIDGGPVAGTFFPVGGVVEASMKFQVTKFYPLDQPFSGDLKATLASIWPMFKRALGTQFHFFSLMSGKGLNPGDSVVFEENVSSGFLSALIKRLGTAIHQLPGTFGFLFHVDLDCSHDFLHRYRTTMQKRLDGLLTARTERFSETVCGPVGQVGVHLQESIVDLEVDPVRWDVFYFFSLNDDLVEYTLDPSQPDVAKILKGGFIPTLKKAFLPHLFESLRAGGSGITPLAEDTTKNTGRGWKLKLLKYQRGDSESTVHETFQDLTDGKPEISSVDRVEAHVRDHFRSTLHYSLGVRTGADGDTTEKAGTHSLWLRVHFDGSHTSAERMRELLAMGDAFRDSIPKFQRNSKGELVETHQLEHLQALLAHWETADPKEKARSQFDFYLNLDTQAVTDALSGKPGEASSRFRAAYEQVTRNSTSPHKEQLLQDFINAVGKGLAESDALKQALTLMHELDESRFSIYPFAALVQSFKDRSHVLVSYRLIASADDPKKQLPVDFARAGNKYTPVTPPGAGVPTIDRPGSQP